MNMRRWLSRSPAPAKLRVDGKLVHLEGGRKKWADAERAIEALEADKVEALADDGSILRVLKLTVDEDEDEEKKKKGGQSEIAQLAKIITDSSDQAAARATEGMTSAFNALMHLVTVLAKRLTSIEMAYHRMITKSAESAPDELDAMAQAVLGQALGVAPPPQQAPFNGNGKK